MNCSQPDVFSQRHLGVAAEVSGDCIDRRKTQPGSGLCSSSAEPFNLGFIVLPYNLLFSTPPAQSADVVQFAAWDCC